MSRAYPVPELTSVPDWAEPFSVSPTNSSSVFIVCVCVCVCVYVCVCVCVVALRLIVRCRCFVDTHNGYNAILTRKRNPPDMKLKILVTDDSDEYCTEELVYSYVHFIWPIDRI